MEGRGRRGSAGSASVTEHQAIKDKHLCGNLKQEQNIEMVPTWDPPFPTTFRKE